MTYESMPNGTPMKPFNAALFAGALLLSLTSASENVWSQRGLTPAQIQYYCSLGAQTPISVRPYCGGTGAGLLAAALMLGGECGYQRPLSPAELQYYCSQGSQTPVSVRNDCIRYGYW